MAQLKALFFACRPHFFAFPVGAALAGFATLEDRPPPGVVLAFCLVSAMGWGVGQLLNDAFDVEADTHDAPDRPLLTGALSMRTAIGVAIVIGALLTGTLALLHRWGWAGGLIAALLIVSYNYTKPVPLLGNLWHGALLSWVAYLAAVIGDSSDPSSFLSLSHWQRPGIWLPGVWAALYLQGNYEKDEAGDRLAGARTLATVLGLRASAALRALSFFALGVWALGSWPLHVGTALFALGCALCTGAAAKLVRKPKREVARSSYRLVVHGGTLGMLGLGAPGVGVHVVGVLAIVSMVVTELAFRRSPNP